MIIFLVSLIPLHCLLWALILLLFYRELFAIQFGNQEAFNLIIPPLVVLIIVALLFVPLRFLYNKFLSKVKGDEESTYMEVAHNFLTDYDNENPVTKNSGRWRLLDIKMSYAAKTKE